MIPYAESIKYMLAGYIIIIIVFFSYLISLFRRWRKLKQDLASLENLDHDPKQSG